jgi:hypothetical protein
MEPFDTRFPSTSRSLFGERRNSITRGLIIER